MDDHEHDDETVQPRGRHGKFDRDPETVAKEAEATRLRSRGYSYRRIATEMNTCVSHAYQLVQNALKETLEEPAAELRALELRRLDGELERLADLEEQVKAVLGAQHVTVQQGQVVMLDGQPIPDDAAKLAAVDRLLKIEDARRKNSAERRKLLGLDAAQKLEQQVEVSGALRYEVVGVDPADLT